MGHSVQGASRAWLSHVLRYGLRTINGTTEGVSVDAPARAAKAKGASLMAIERATSRLGDRRTGYARTKTEAGDAKPRGGNADSIWSTWSKATQ